MVQNVGDFTGERAPEDDRTVVVVKRGFPAVGGAEAGSARQATQRLTDDLPKPFT
jgi:hypothetical protein